MLRQTFYGPKSKGLVRLIERHPRKTSLLAGVLLAAAFAPFHVVPALIAALAGFAVLLRRATAAFPTSVQRWYRFRVGFELGWCFGFGFFLAGLWWIGAAFLIEAEEFAWALPLAVLGLPAVLAVFWALASGCVACIDQSDLGYTSALTIAFTLAEILRGSVLSGFPWNAVGYGIMPIPVLMQSASVIGLWGVTLLAFFSSFCIGVSLLASKRDKGVLLISAAICLAVHLGFGMVHLPDAQVPNYTSPSNGNALPSQITLRLIQPNILQNEKWQPENRQRIFDTYISLSTEKPLGGIDAVIWPESAFPYLIEESETSLKAIADFLPPGTLLISGAVVARPGQVLPKNGQLVAGQFFHNSMLLWDDQATALGVYHKRKLVPFGEYVPAGRFLGALGITNLVKLPGGFSAGQEDNQSLSRSIQGFQTRLPFFSALICYEAIFPGFGRQQTNWVGGSIPGDTRSHWLLNLTNDAWFGDLLGPYQHFHQARLRAVETGLPLIRVANSGISAVVDPYGRILDAMPLGESGYIDVNLPEALPATVYAIHGDRIALLLILALLLQHLWFRRRFKRTNAL